MLFRLLAVQFLSTNDNAARYISVTLMVMKTQMGYISITLMVMKTQEDKS